MQRRSHVQFALTFLTLATLALMVWGGTLLQRSQNMKDWRHAKGMVVKTSIESQRVQSLTDSRVWTLVYTPHVIYEYSVNGRRYASSRLDFTGTPPGKASKALKVMDKYRKNPNVTVFYNPRAPKESVLDGGLVVDTLLFWIMAGILFAFGIGVFNLLRPEDTLLPSNVDYLHRGYVYQNRGKLNEALAEYNKAVDVCPRDPSGYVHRGTIYFQKGDWDRAIMDFEQATTLDPNNTLAKTALANAYVEKENDQTIRTNLAARIDE